MYTYVYIYIYFEEGTSGGISYYISSKYSKANNMHLKFHNPKLQSEHSISLDTNKLYGNLTSKLLPISRFKWIDPKDFEWNKYSSNTSKKYVSEVDFECIKELRELRKFYYLSPNKIERKRKMLAEYQIKVAYLCNIPICNGRNLAHNFLGKEKYVL